MSIKISSSAVSMEVIYTFFISFTSTILLLLGENRVDVYMSLYILEYFILRALYHPMPEDVNRRLRIIDIIYIIIFGFIVSYRVLEIIAPNWLWFL